MLHPEVIGAFQKTLDCVGLDRDSIDYVDPYNWGSHIHRLALWIVKGNINIVDPPDKMGQFKKFNDVELWLGELTQIMRPLDQGNIAEFEKRVQKNGFEIVSYPPRRAQTLP